MSSDLAAGVVGARIAKDAFAISERSDLIVAVHAALVQLTAPPVPAVETPTPPVPIRESATPDHVIDLEGGKPHR